MKALFIFDDKVRINKIKLEKLKNIKTVYLYPLTSKMSITRKITEVFHNSEIRVEVLNTSMLINQFADKIRARYIKLIAELPERIKIKGQNLKELFATPDQVTSLWWFSLIAEKNTLKTDNFNKIAQLHSIAKTAKEIDAKYIFYGTVCNRLKSSLKLYSYSNSIIFLHIPTKKLRSLKNIVYDFQGTLFLKHMLFALYNLWLFFLRARKIKKKLKKMRGEKILLNPILIITYYPNIDIDTAKDGIFKNKYYPLLQDELERKGKNIIWIAMYMQHNNVSFDECIDYAIKFVKNGYDFYFLEEFLDLKGLLRALQIYILSSIRFLGIRKKIDGLHLLEGEDYNFYPIMKEEWYSSFAGSVALRGIIYYEIFKNIFHAHNLADTCLYYFENHSWEKTLVCARDCVQKKIELFGYQHATVSRMLLNYFNHESETREGNDLFPMPRPDKVICNGNLPYHYMRESGWSGNRLVKAEAIRYNYLKKNLPYNNFTRKKDIVLVCFSINIDESCAILNAVLDGLGDEKKIKVWIKAHPFLKVDKVLSNLGIKLKDLPFEVKDEPINYLLASSKVVIAGQSGVSVEALAFGCKIVILDIPEMINMSPLRYIESSAIRIADSPRKLREHICEIITNIDLAQDF